MIGFIVSPQTAAGITAAIAAAQTDRGHPVFWLPGARPIIAGEHAGKTFIPFDDVTMATVLHTGKTPMDYPETAALLEKLGGLEARAEIGPEHITTRDTVP